jgi:nicotinamidase-related amidase
MLDKTQTCLVVVDVQEKLFGVMPDQEALADQAVRLIEGLNVLEVPVLRCEQNPRGLGPTIAPIAELLTEAPIEKRAFSCCGEAAFVSALEALSPKSVLLAGIETHICVYQTAADLRDKGYEVQVVADAVASRSQSNHRIGLERIRQRGATITSVETCLFELLGSAEGDAFKRIIKIVK